MEKNKNATIIDQDNETQVLQIASSEVIEASEKAHIDVQIATAKRFPRDLKRCVNNSIAIVTIDQETAMSCNYCLPRAEKKIQGKSVHLARVLAQQYGNIRAESKIVGITENQVISQAVCLDLETNYAVKIEVRKSIIGKRGRYNEDMIVVTGNAANAIAFRNAVYYVIPKSVSDSVYKAALEKITGDLSDENKLIAKRQKVIDGFKDTYAVTEKEILKMLNLQTINQVKQDEIVQLIGIAQALKDGDTTVDEAFGRIKTEQDKIDKIYGSKGTDGANKENLSKQQQQGLDFGKK